MRRVKGWFAMREKDFDTQGRERNTKKKELSEKCH
jgi:hypothetical protein